MSLDTEVIRTEIAKLEIQAGDVLVIKTDSYMSEKVYNLIDDTLLPFKAVIVFPYQTDLMVIRELVSQ